MDNFNGGSITPGTKLVTPGTKLD